MDELRRDDIPDEITDAGPPPEHVPPDPGDEAPDEDARPDEFHEPGSDASMDPGALERAKSD